MVLRYNYKKQDPAGAKKSYVSLWRCGMSNKVHGLRAGCFEAFPPHGKVKSSPASAHVGVSQIFVEVETGTGADDLIFVVSGRAGDC